MTDVAEMTASSWKVDWAQEVTNVLVNGTITFSQVPDTNSLRCSVNSFVHYPNSNLLPVKWAAATFDRSVTGFFSGPVKSADESKTFTITMNVSSGTLTCSIDPDDSPGSTWTGKH